MFFKNSISFTFASRITQFLSLNVLSFHFPQTSICLSPRYLSIVGLQSSVLFHVAFELLQANSCDDTSAHDIVILPQQIGANYLQQ